MSTTTNMDETVQETLWSRPDSRRAVYQTLSRMDEPTARELTDKCGYGVATVYRSLNDLKAAGLVDRRPNLFNPDGGDLWTVTDGETA